MPAHSTLTGADLHEPKGIAAAAATKVYLSDGLGSGSWVNPSYAVTAVIPDVSTVDQVYIPIPFAGTITQIGSAAGDIDILNPVSNNTVTNDSRIRIDTDGACDTTRKLFVTAFVRGS